MEPEPQNGGFGSDDFPQKRGAVFFKGSIFLIFGKERPKETPNFADKLPFIRGKGAAREPEPKPGPPESAVPGTALAPAAPPAPAAKAPAPAAPAAPPAPAATAPAPAAPAAPTPAATPKPAVPSTTAVPKMVANGKGKVAEVTWKKVKLFRSQSRTEDGIELCPKEETESWIEIVENSFYSRMVIEQAFGNLT